MANNVQWILDLRDRVTGTAKRIQRSLDQVQRTAERAGMSLDKMDLIAAGLAVGGLAKLGADLEQAKLKFEVLTGSAEKGRKIFEDLKQFANATPYSNEGVNKGATLLMAYGIEANKTASTLKMLGDVAMGNQDNFNGLALAYGQIMAKGRLLAQENNQLSERGFNPLQLIAEKTGKTYKELSKIMEKGGISSQMVAQAFEVATSAGGKFYQMSQRMSTTLGGRMSTTLGTARDKLGELGLQMQGLFKDVLNVADGLIAFIGNNQKAIAVVLEITVKLGAMALALYGIKKAIAGVTVAWRVLNLVMKANPIVLIISAIVAVGVALYTMYQRVESFRDGVNKIWDSIVKGVSKFVAFYSGYVMAVIEMWKQLWETAKRIGAGIVGVFKSIWSFATGDFEAGKAEWSNAMKGFVTSFDGFGDAIVSKYSETSAKVLKKLQEMRDKAGKSVSAFSSLLKNGADNSTVFDFNTTAVNAVNADAEEEKRRKESIVRGGAIRSFVINIGNLTGVETMNVGRSSEGATMMGQTVRDELLRVLADVQIQNV